MKYITLVSLLAIGVAAGTGAAPENPEALPSAETPIEGASPATAPDASAKVRFGDGRRGRIPVRQGVSGGGNEISLEDTKGSEVSEGDPDRPVVTGRLYHSNTDESRERPAASGPQRTDDDG